MHERGDCATPSRGVPRLLSAWIPAGVEPASRGVTRELTRGEHERAGADERERTGATREYELARAYQRECAGTEYEYERARA